MIPRRLPRTRLSRFTSTCVFMLAIVVAHFTSGVPVRAEKTLPNVVFVIADDLGWADVGFHGGFAPTPRLDALAREGTELAAHYVAPVCSPTRTGLMTGRYWSRFGVTTPTNERALPWDTVTLASLLRSAGYDTCLSGKWHLGSRPEEGPNRFGFDHAYGSLAGGVTSWDHRYKSGPFSETWHRNGTLIEEEGHVTDLITDEAITWLEERGDRPFFLYVPYTAVHLPVDEPNEWLDRVPESIQGTESKMSAIKRHYAACVMHLDHSVGRILDTLDRLGKRENTLFVFTSDNGGSTAENRDLKYPNNEAPKGRLPGRNDPWRGQKGDVYEGGIRVPTLVSWPTRVPATRIDHPVHIVDWMPTIAALAGLTPEASLRFDGVNLLPLLTSSQTLEERPLYCVGPGGRARSLHLGDWKLVVRLSGKETITQVFNLKNDPAETDNVAGAEPEKTAELKDRLREISQSDNDSRAQRR